MGFFSREEKTTEELKKEIEDECYAMAFGADIPEVFMEYEDAKTGSDEQVREIAKRFGISLYK